MLAVSLKSRGVGPVGPLPPLRFLNYFDSERERERERTGAKTKSQNLIISGYTHKRKIGKSVICCSVVFKMNLLNVKKSVFFKAFSIDLFVSSVMHNLVDNVNKSLSGFFVT